MGRRGASGGRCPRWQGSAVPSASTSSQHHRANDAPVTDNLVTRRSLRALTPSLPVAPAVNNGQPWPHARYARHAARLTTTATARCCTSIAARSFAPSPCGPWVAMGLRLIFQAGGLPARDNSGSLTAINGCRPRNYSHPRPPFRVGLISLPLGQRFLSELAQRVLALPIDDEYSKVVELLLPWWSRPVPVFRDTPVRRPLLIYISTIISFAMVSFHCLLSTSHRKRQNKKRFKLATRQTRVTAILRDSPKCATRTKFSASDHLVSQCLCGRRAVAMSRWLHPGEISDETGDHLVNCASFLRHVASLQL